jgi:flagellar hook-associated protein 3 FlgL
MLQLKTRLSQNGQIRANVGRVKAEVDTAEKSLQQCVRLVDRAIVLASQAAGSLQTAESRARFIEEARGIHEQIVAISRTSVDGRFIFSGDAEADPPYELDLTAGEGVRQLTTADATRQVLEPAGTTFVASRTAQRLFDARDTNGDPTAGNVFAAAHRLTEGLVDNDPGAIDSALSALRSASQHLNSQLSWYGVIQNRVSAAYNASDSFELQIKTRLSELQDADIVEAALELTQAQTHQDATMAAQARFRPRSLFEFLG